MIDIAKLHRSAKSPKILGKFFATSGYKHIAEYLRGTGLEDADITMRTQPHRGAVGVAKVHPIIVIEYMRWVDFDTYASWITKRAV